MRRKSFDALVSFGGLLMVVVLLVAGALLFWGYSYANNSVSSQLSAQKISFPTKAELAAADEPSTGRVLGDHPRDAPLPRQVRRPGADHRCSGTGVR